MRFISKYPGHKFYAIGQQVEVLASGAPRIVKPGYICRFNPSDVTDWERDEARKRFRFTGTVTEQDGTPIDPVLSRVSTFDTATIKDPDLRAEVEKRMLENAGHDFILVEKPKLRAPWPRYEETKGGGRGITTAAAIAERVADLGLDPRDVIAYERENQDRPDVIEALEALEAPSEAEEIVLA